jgi:hypothetical protein
MVFREPPRVTCKVMVCLVAEETWQQWFMVTEGWPDSVFHGGPACALTHPIKAKASMPTMSRFFTYE